VVALAAYYSASKAKQLAEKAGAAIDPTSTENVFYQGVNKVGATLTGKDNFNLGFWIYDKLHGGDNAN
jgi:hypothetical protein